MQTGIDVKYEWRIRTGDESLNIGNKLRKNIYEEKQKLALSDMRLMKNIQSKFDIIKAVERIVINNKKKMEST